MPSYSDVTSSSRYSPAPALNTITPMRATYFDVAIAGLLEGKYTSIESIPIMDIKDHLNPGESALNTFFTESGGFHVNGNLFFNWFMEKSAKAKGGDNKEHSRYYWFMNSMYFGKLDDLDMNNTFLVVEPILHLRKVNGTKTNEDYTIASWYGYISSYEAGNAYTIIKRMGYLADGFNLQRTSYITSETEQAIKNVLDTNILTDNDLYKIKTNPNGSVSQTNFRVNNKHKTFGFAMQAFWLESTSTSIPIDTYDIINQTQNEPTPPEEPKDENKTTGEKTIIKLYADLYSDPTTGYFTEIKDIKNGDSYSFVRTNTSDKVTITDEQQINGYTSSAWYLSDKNYPEASSEDNAMLKDFHQFRTFLITSIYHVSKASGFYFFAKIQRGNFKCGQKRIIFIIIK